MDSKIIREFPVTVYGNLTKFSETISKARCRIFYKYANRNGTYISDAFAEKLISSIPYTPIKGIYDEFDEDYTDHGQAREEGRIYGIVPENPNFQWEKHLDEDGIEREYACVDVLIFTALYKEASEVINKSQSMEIYEPSIKGNWKMIGGRRLYEYTDGCFLGLQILGDNVEPCFEGAAFFSLYDSVKALIKEIEKFSLNNSNLENGGQSKMEMLKFKLSDNQKHDAIWTLLNSEYNEEGGWVINYAICDIYDEYALVYNYENASYERVYYTKNDEENSVSISEKVQVFVVDVTESELNALNTIKALNGGTYENINAKFELVEELEGQINVFTAQVEELNAQISENETNFEQKIEELNNNISTLETEKEQFTNQLNEANEQISSLTEEVNSLNSYKTEIENNEKKAVIDSYSELLSEEVLSAYEEKLSDYTLLDLDKELAYELKKNNISAFTQTTPQIRIPKDGESATGLEAILSKYKK